MLALLQKVENWVRKNEVLVVRLCFWGIVMLAAGLRFWNLGSLPFGFHSDEVMNGYVGRYILENGRDLYGNVWSMLYFDHFGDYPNVLPMYLSGFSALLYGSSVWAVRLPIALFGVATVMLVFTVSRWLWKSPWIGLIAALCLAVFPWHVILSRATAEGITASFVFLLGFFVLFRSIERDQVKGVVLSIGLLLLTYLLYPGFRVGVPLALLPAFFFAANRQMKYLLLGATVLCFVLTAFVSQTFWGKGRFKQTSFLAPNIHIEARTLQYSTALGEGKALEGRLFYNRYVLTGRELVRQYASYFSPEFLAADAGLPPRYVGPEQALIFWTPFGVLALAIIVQFAQPWKQSEISGLFHNKRGKYFLWILWLLATAPIPAALTYNDVPNIHRAALMVVLLPFVFAPAWYLLTKVRLPLKPLIVAVTFAVLFAEVVLFWQGYSRIYSTWTGFARQDEQLQLANWLQENASKYERVYVPGNEVMPLFYLFAQNRYPAELAGQFSSGITVPQIDNVYFVHTHCPSEIQEVRALVGTMNVLLAERSECDSSNEFSVIDHIEHLDTSKAYDLLETRVE